MYGPLLPYVCNPSKRNANKTLLERNGEKLMRRKKIFAHATQSVNYANNVIIAPGNKITINTCLCEM